MTPASDVRALAQVHTAVFLILLLVNVVGKAVEDSPDNMSSSIYTNDLAETLGSLHFASLSLSVTLSLK